MSLFDEGDAALLKKWVITRLENISDADSDVLADYVVTLLRHEQSEDEVRQMCIDQLDDFLREHTPNFVDELFAALRSRSYLSINSSLHSGLLTTDQATTATTTPSTLQPANDGESSDGSYQPKSPDAPFSNAQPVTNNANPKKRGFYDRDAPGAQTRDGGHYTGNSRNKNPKAAKRGGGRGGNGDKWNRGAGNFGRNGPGPPALAIPHQQPAFPMAMPPGPFGTDPMAHFVAAQALAAVQGGWNPLAMFQPGMLPKPENHPFNTQKKGICHSFQAKGFCRRGDSCPYSHGPSPLVIPPMKGPDEDEYDPNTPMLSPQDLERGSSFPLPAKPFQPAKGSNRGGRGGNRGGRSEFASRGAPRDASSKALVIESIPDDKIDEESIRGYFVTFGPIESVDIKPEKKLAILKFEAHDDAKKAYSSPEPIFNNRFVKVYWLKTDEERQHAQQQGDEMEIDMEDFQKKQTEAQKVYEERQAKKKEIEEQAKKLEEQTAELLRKQEEEKKKLLAKLSKKHAAKETANGADKSEASDKESKDAAQTAVLKAQLEALEAEASFLGIDHSKVEGTLPDFQSSFRGRGFRARGGFGGFPTRGAYAPRGRGAFGAYRGGYQHAGRGAGGPKKMTLDNRSKTVLVTGVPQEHVEALQQFMLACGSQYIKLDTSPEVDNSHIITFSTRGDAARFIHSNLTVPPVGKVEASWVEMNKGISNASTPAAPENGTGDGDVDLGDVGDVQHGLDQYDVYDVADDDDSRWG